ncbi:MAG: hypothetical protein FIB07_03360 [Candidatus Methanoperedens sp.]|nr:hypothetical protein [Candidatus Methanoperedens sp.]
MTSKQLFLMLLLFILALVVMTLPVWIDRALPMMRNSINSAGKTFEDMWVALKYIADRLSEDIPKLMDKYL